MNDTTRRSIFGYGVSVSGPPDLRERVDDELALYAAAAGSEPSLDIEFVDAIPAEDGAYVNPGIHEDLSDGFVVDYGTIKVRFEADDHGRLRRARVAPRPSSRLGDVLQRGRHLEYTTIQERMGQLLHELVLVPAVYFQPNLAPVHAAGVQDAHGRVTMIGGTGGVGKTSLELELCRRRGLLFCADDIAVLDGDGNVWPNLSYPKIYGYNVVDDDALKKTVLGSAGPVNRLQWAVKHRRSPARVRRRVSPVALYGGHAAAPGALTRYIIIVRDRSTGIELRPLEPKDAAAMSLAVMQTEYNVFDNQVRWHEFNRRARQAPPIVQLEQVRQRWQDIYERTFARTECLLIRAAKDMPHKQFIQKAADIITGTTEDAVRG